MSDFLKKNNIIQNLTIIIIHVIAFYALFFSTYNKQYLIVCILLTYLRLFSVSAGIHRLFCHRSFVPSKGLRFVLALLGTLSLQNSIFWWAANHRQHHKSADTVKDPHNHKKGFFWSHIGWIMADLNKIDKELIKDLYQIKELVFFDKNYNLINLMFALGFLFLFGIDYFIWGYCLSIFFSWHITFIANSMCHRFGYTSELSNNKDNSKNLNIISVLTLGESLHGNHHSRPSNPNNKIKNYELDPTYWILYVLSKMNFLKFR